MLKSNADSLEIRLAGPDRGTVPKKIGSGPQSGPVYFF